MVLNGEVFSCVIIKITKKNAKFRSDKKEMIGVYLRLIKYNTRVLYITRLCFQDKERELEKKSIERNMNHE